MGKRRRGVGMNRGGERRGEGVGRRRGGGGLFSFFFF